MSIIVIEEANRVEVSSPAPQVTVQSGRASTSVVEQPVVVTVTQVTPRIEVTASGAQGTPGPPGSPGAGANLHRNAATNLSGHRVVTPHPDGTVGYADNTNFAHYMAPLWLTLGAALVGMDVEIQQFGPVTEGSWSWAPGPVYLGAAGVLTQVTPMAPAFLAIVGFATSPTELFVDRQPTIALI